MFFRKNIKQKQIIYNPPKLESYCWVSCHRNNKPPLGNPCIGASDENITTEWFKVPNPWYQDSNPAVGMFLFLYKGKIWTTDLSGAYNAAVPCGVRKPGPHEPVKLEFSELDVPPDSLDHMIEEEHEYSNIIIDGNLIDEGQDREAVSYLYSARFTINKEDYSLTLKLNYLRYWFDRIPLGLEASACFTPVTYRLSIGSQSKANLELLDVNELRHRPNYMPPEILKEIETVLRELMVLKYGKDFCPSFEVKSLVDAFAIAYFPTEPRLFYFLKDVYMIGGAPKDYLNQLGISYLGDKSDPNLFYKYFGKVPTSIKKMYLKDPFYLLGYKILKEEYGLEDINLIREELIKISPNKTLHRVPNNSPLKPSSLVLIGNNQFSIKSLIDAKEPYLVLIREFNCTPKKALKILLTAKREITLGMWQDTRDMFMNYRNRFAKDSDVIKKLLKQGFTTEVHYLLSSEITKIKQENINFEYQPNQIKRYNHSIQVDDETYEYCLASCTHQLIEIGQKLSICVGSAGYGERVLNHKCLIICVKKDDDFVGCIEVRKETKVQQARTYCNYGFEGNLQKSFVKWIDLTKLTFQGNYF